MEGNPSQTQSYKQKAQDLQAFTTGGSLSSSISKVSCSSRAIPHGKDFHFYNNFEQFKKPIKEIDAKSKSMLQSIGSSAHIWGKPAAFPQDLDEAYDWLVGVNDEVFERFDVCTDEFQRVRKVEEETGRRAALEDSENGFQLVGGKKKRATIHSTSGLDEGRNSTSIEVKVASRDSKAMWAKPKVPFHIPTIPRPQNEFNILVNNTNKPFEHVWLQKSEDGSRFVHPLENLSFLDFVDKTTGDVESVKPLPVESSSFKLVEEVKDLKDLAAKLRSVNEFAVDLEHNQYRSFQGLTCLMQISTRTEDFVVDTLKLRIQIGPYLREAFKDPTKKKVMHGADRDIVWLQRDFGIYVCNLFDTGQASRVLKLERNSLEYLLHHFCGVTANKEYQNADWRLRPLPDEMLRYAREDTHYLLHIYDLMRKRLLTESIDVEKSDSLLEEVYKRSYDICMQLYEKELLTESSYLHIYGLRDIDFSPEQLSVIAGLCEWRDAVARVEDESTGYILPNKTLLEIAKQLPATANKLRRLLRSKHPYIEQNIASVVGVIRHSIQNATAFIAVAEQLKKERLELATQEKEAVVVQALTNTNDTQVGSSSEHHHHHGELIERESLSISVQRTDTSSVSSFAKAMMTGAGAATIQVLKKPSGAFGAMLGSSASKRKFDMAKKENEAIKLEQIKSSVNLPFHTFAGGKDEASKVTDAGCKLDDDGDPINVIVEDVISLEEEAVNGEAPPMSLSELSSSFQKCLHSSSGHEIKKVEESEFVGGGGFASYDYEAAKKEMCFGGGEKSNKDKRSSNPPAKGKEKKKKKKKKSVGEEPNKEFQQGKRSQAFPATGNRSATFR